MLVVCGTAAFRKRLRLAAAPDPLPADTTTLGDWHAHIVIIERRPCAMFVNSASLLTVIVDVAPRSDVMDRFRTHLGRVLRDTGKPASHDDLEDRFRDEIWSIIDYRSPLDVIRGRFALPPVSRRRGWRPVPPP